MGVLDMKCNQLEIEDTSKSKQTFQLLEMSTPLYHYSAKLGELVHLGFPDRGVLIDQT